MGDREPGAGRQTRGARPPRGGGAGGPRGDRMDIGPTLAKGHPQSLDHGCNVRSTCRCSVYPAIHTTTRSLLRSSSTHEPSDPPLRVVLLVGRLHWGDAIWGFETEIPDRKPANLGEAGGTHGNGLFGRPAGRRRGRPLAAPWTRHGGGGEPPFRGSTGPRSPRAGKPGVAREIGAGRQSGGLGRRRVVADGPQRRARHPRGCFVWHALVGAVTLMILPQVHLRKPCYDFYFL